MVGNFMAPITKQIAIAAALLMSAIVVPPIYFGSSPLFAQFIASMALLSAMEKYNSIFSFRHKFLLFCWALWLFTIFMWISRSLWGWFSW
jgi:hypothetical protein